MVLAGPAHADRAFAPRFTANAKGDIVHTGNTLMTCPASDLACAAAQDGTASGAPSNNNSFAMEYVDVDADGTTFNSSTAGLTLPAGAQVLFAGLYYGGNTAAGGEPERATTLLDTPAPGGYVTVTADQLDDFVSSDPTQHIYGGFADITSLVATGGSGDYTVANVQAEQGDDHHAGWGIVVAYQDDDEDPRNLTVFDGLIGINPMDPDVNFTLTGFQTPATGTVNADLGLILWEGDNGLTGDEILLDGTQLSDATNPATNFNNSTISFGGSHFTAKAPNYVNQLGYDNDIINTDGLLGNSQTSADLTLRTTGDRWVHQVITFAPDILQPDVQLQKAAVDVNGGRLLPGDEIEYTVTGTNAAEAAAELTLTDAIPANTTYVPGSLNEVVGANAGAKTDVAGDDQAEFQAGLDQAVFRLGTGADAVQGGLLAPGEDFEVSFRVQVDLGTPPATTITNVATADFSGETTGIDYSVDSNPADVTVEDPLADVRTVKTITRGFPRVGNQLTYRIRVFNDGPDPATSVDVSDTFDGAAVELVSVSTDTGTCTDTLPFTCSLGQLNSGAVAEITLVVRLVEAGRLVNTADASSPVTDPDPTNNSDDALANVAPARTTVKLRKVATVKTIVPRQRFGYRITFTNLGPGPALDVRICDRLPKQLRFLSASGGGSYDRGGREVCWTADSVAPGAKLRLKLNVRANKTLPKVRKIRNLVIATGSNFPDAKAAAYINCGRTITQ
jgi:uncharacterized repeat protein (TIGR01451 family)